MKVLRNKNIVAIFMNYQLHMKKVFAFNRSNFCLIAFPFISVRFSVFNIHTGHYELMIPQEKLWDNWVWSIQWSPFRMKQVRLLENDVSRPRLKIEFQKKLPIKPSGLIKIALNRLSINGTDIERKPSKLSLTSCELENARPINLSQLNPQ